MRRSLIATSLAGSFIIFSLTIDLFDAIFMFVFFGVIPFTTEPIPAMQMLLVYMAAGLFVLSYALRFRIKSVYSSARRRSAHVNAS